MGKKYLDITGNISPFCILTIERKAKALLPSDELIITCDSVPAATTLIPRIARNLDLATESHRISADIWEITLEKRL